MVPSYFSVLTLKIELQSRVNAIVYRIQSLRHSILFVGFIIEGTLAKSVGIGYSAI